MKDSIFTVLVFCVLTFLLLLISGNKVRKQSVLIEETGIHAITLQKRIEKLEERCKCGIGGMTTVPGLIPAK